MCSVHIKSIIMSSAEKKNSPLHIIGQYLLKIAGKIVVFCAAPRQNPFKLTDSAEMFGTFEGY